MSAPYKDGPSQCPKCGAPTQYTASGDTESQGYFGTHRYSPVRDVARLAALLKGEVFRFAEPDNEKLAAALDRHGVRLDLARDP